MVVHVRFNIEIQRVYGYSCFLINKGCAQGASMKDLWRGPHVSNCTNGIGKVSRPASKT